MNTVWRRSALQRLFEVVTACSAARFVSCLANSTLCRRCPLPACRARSSAAPSSRHARRLGQATPPICGTPHWLPRAPLVSGPRELAGERKRVGRAQALCRSSLARADACHWVVVARCCQRRCVHMHPGSYVQRRLPICSCCADKVVKQELAFGFKDFGCLFNGENFTFPGELRAAAMMQCVVGTMLWGGAGCCEHALGCTMRPALARNGLHTLRSRVRQTAPNCNARRPQPNRVPAGHCSGVGQCEDACPPAVSTRGWCAASRRGKVAHSFRPVNQPASGA